MPYLHVVFIGHHRERLMKSIEHWSSQYPPRRFILVTGRQELSGTLRAMEIAEKMRDDLVSRIISVNIVPLEMLDTVKAILSLIELLGPEMKQGYEIILNTSGSLRIFSVIAYILACLLNLRIVSANPRFDEEDHEIGIESFFEIPILLRPELSLTLQEREILHAIGSGQSSLKELITVIRPGVGRGAGRKMDIERTRIKPALDTLEREGLIERIQEQNRKRIILTTRGAIYAKAFSALQSAENP